MLHLPTLNPIPEDISDHVHRLFHTTPPLTSTSLPELEDWLFELIKGSGHLSIAGDMYWRALCLVWLATQFNADKAWPYLMWLNMNQPVLSDQLAEILSEGADEFDCRVQVANWLANTTDDRLITFFKEYRHIPGHLFLEDTFTRLIARGKEVAVGVWLRAFYHDAHNTPAAYLDPWQLLTAAWYATCFDYEQGLTMLKEVTDGTDSLSEADIATLTKTLKKINGMAIMVQWVAECPHSAVKTMLKELNHPNLTTFVADIFNAPPDYSHLELSLEQANAQAKQAVAQFKQALTLLEAVDVDLKNNLILDLGCGPLAPQTVLFNANNYQITGVDLHIPPTYLPLTGVKQRLKRGKYVKAWQQVTAPYYQQLVEQTELKLKWNKLNINLADLTRLPFDDNSFNAVLCFNYLQHCLDVNALLLEAARVLKVGGFMVADFIPYPASTDPILSDLYQTLLPTNNIYPYINKWVEDQYKTAFEKYFKVEQWLIEETPINQSELTPDLRAKLAERDAGALSRQRVVVLVNFVNL